MKFLNNQLPVYDLTYQDAFLVPNKSPIKSRMAVDTTSLDGLNMTTPVIASNMNTVAGKRMAETMARRGAMVMLLQNMPIHRVKKAVEYVKSKDPVFETPITLTPDDHVQHVLNLIHKRAHGAVVIVDDKDRPIGVFTEGDAKGEDRYEHLRNVMSKDVVALENTMDLNEMFGELTRNHLDFAPVIEKGKLVGAVTRKGIIRSTIHTPNVDDRGRLKVGCAIGINEDVKTRVKAFSDMGIDAILLDTAHGHQQGLIDAVKLARKTNPKLFIIAGTVVTAQGTKDIIEAGANMVKVGIGAGGACTTRVMTGVGRPQLSAVIETVEAAKKAGGYVLADGGIRHPRDVALALAVGATNTMFGAWLAGTYESAGDVHIDPEGKMYKEYYGMASNRAVNGRARNDDPMTRAKKAFFEEGISNSKMYLTPGSESVEDILDQIVAGLRSAMSYTGANDLKEFHDKAVLGIQSPAGFNEGKPVHTSWNL